MALTETETQLDRIERQVEALVTVVARVATLLDEFEPYLRRLTGSKTARLLTGRRD